MAKYEYRCTTINCKKRNEVIVIDKPMKEAGTTEYCSECGEALRKIFGSSIKTGDGFKS